MKIRSRFIKEAFWSDKIIGRVPPLVRLVYIGLWMVCDDAGWSRNDPEEIGAALFLWDSPADRERAVTEALATLEKASRVVLHPCGHLQIPTLGRYQRPGRPTYQYRDEHRNCMVSSGYSFSSLREGRGVGVGGELLDNENGTPSSPRARAHEGGDTTFKEAMQRHGHSRS